MTSRTDSLERRLLRAYQSKTGKRVFSEVPIAGAGEWGKGCTNRFIDGVAIGSIAKTAASRVPKGNRSAIKAACRGKNIDVIEVKRALNRGVIGQAVVARQLFKREYGAKSVRAIALVAQSDPALAWCCKKLKIDVVVISRAEAETYRIGPARPRVRTRR